MAGSELWVYLDDEGGRSSDRPARMVAEGRRIGRASGLRVCGVVRHSAAAERLQSAGRYFDLDGLYALGEDPEDTNAAPAVVAIRLGKAVEAGEPRLLILPASASGAELAARVAARLRRPFLSRCVDLEWRDGRPIGRRTVCNGRAHQIVAPAGDPPWLATLDPQVLESPAAPTPAALPVEILDRSSPDKTGGVTTWRVPARDLGVLDADIVLSVGRGVSAATLPQVHELAELLNAAIGGSREAVFGGLVPRERQVGASGKWIAPRVYVALGISGSTYHLMGIREAHHVVAINRDAGAPIMARAEVGIVADLDELVPVLLAAARAGTAPAAARRAEAVSG